MDTLSKKQIEEIKTLLLENKEKIVKVLNNLQNEQDELSDITLIEDTDFAVASRDYSKDVRIKLQQQKELNMINHALMKIEKGTFTGLCEMCDAPITIQRLRVKPHAKFCIDCREFIDKKA